MMQGITEAERLARWQARIQFEELCEEVRTWNQVILMWHHLPNTGSTSRNAL